MLGTGLPQKRKSKLWITHSRASHWERTEIILNKIPRYWINTTAVQIPAAEAGDYRGCLPQLCVALFATRAAAAEQAQEHPCQQDESPPAAGSTDLRLPESPPPRAELPECCPHPQARGYPNDTTQTPLTLLRVSSGAANNNFPLH